MSAQLDYTLVVLGSIVILMTIFALALFVALSSKREIDIRSRNEEELKKINQQIRNLTTHLQIVREKERTDVAREIHDELGQSLTAIKMDLYWLKKRLPNSQNGLNNKIVAAIKIVDDAMHTVKRISAQLRPALLDDLGLVAALDWEIEEFQKRMSIKCGFTTHPENLETDKNRSTAIYRITQEALTNVARHAQATTVDVILKLDSGQLFLEVIDNGVGITQEQLSNPTSFGLIGIRERVLQFGGTFDVRSGYDGGTKIKIVLPTEEMEDNS